MKKSICIYNHKGGTGKTSLSGAIACELTLRGQRVLMVDTDSQANLSHQFLSSYKNELANVLMGECEVREAIYKTNYDNLYIMPTKTVVDGGQLDEWGNYKAGEPKNRNKIKNLLRAIDQLNFDYVIWDLAPAYTGFTQLLLVSNDEVIPVLKLDGFSMEGHKNFFKLLDELRAGEENPVFNKIIFNCRDKRISYQNTTLESLKELKLTQYVIPNDTGFIKSQFEHKALQEFNIKKETTTILQKIAADIINEE